MRHTRSNSRVPTIQPVAVAATENLACHWYYRGSSAHPHHSGDKVFPVGIFSLLRKLLFQPGTLQKPLWAFLTSSIFYLAFTLLRIVFLSSIPLTACVATSAIVMFISLKTVIRRRHSANAFLRDFDAKCVQYCVIVETLHDFGIEQNELALIESYGREELREYRQGRVSRDSLLHSFASFAVGAIEGGLMSHAASLDEAITAILIGSLLFVVFGIAPQAILGSTKNERILHSFLAIIKFGRLNHIDPTNIELKSQTVHKWHAR